MVEYLNRLATKIVAAALFCCLTMHAAHAEQIKVSGEDVLSIGDHGKILNNTVFACKMPSEPASYGWMQRLNAGQIVNGEPVKASPDGECWPLSEGTEVELVKTASQYPAVVCVRALSEQSCAWTFKLGIEPVAVYDRERAETKAIRGEVNANFDRVHPECKDFRTNPNLPKYCY